MSDRCPHLEAILADDTRFERGYYESGRERADLIAAITELRQDRDALRATLVRFDHDMSGLRGDLELARDLCEAVERWMGSSFPEDSVLVGDIREAAGVLRDALDGRA